MVSCGSLHRLEAERCARHQQRVAWPPKERVQKARRGLLQVALPDMDQEPSNVGLLPTCHSDLDDTRSAKVRHKKNGLSPSTFHTCLNGCVQQSRMYEIPATTPSWYWFSRMACPSVAERYDKRMREPYQGKYSSTAALRSCFKGACSQALMSRAMIMVARPTTETSRVCSFV